jgi:hypothetical protein
MAASLKGRHSAGYAGVGNTVPSLGSTTAPDK